MKKFNFVLIILASIAINLSVNAQTQQTSSGYEYAGSELEHLTVFVSPIAHFSISRGNRDSSTGFGGGLIFNKKWYAGLYTLDTRTNGVLISHSHNNFSHTHEYRLNHSGLWLGYIYDYNKFLHFTPHIKFGFGDLDRTSNNQGGSDGFLDDVFVIVPQGGIEANLATWLRAEANIGYRILRGLDNNDFDSKSVNNFIFGINLKFGWFDSSPFPKYRK